MNANELADELDKWYSEYDGRFDLIEDATTMLRKQQAEITELKDFAETIGGEANRKIIEQQAQIEALKQVLQSIANEHVELSHDKIKWQCEDHIRWAKEALK
jgi:hypothetical protein